MFQGLRTNSLFYILEKGDNPSLKVGNVTAVSNPQPKFNHFQPSQPFAQPETVVDVSVKVGEQIMEFRQLPSNLSIANSGVVASCDAMMSVLNPQLAKEREQEQKIGHLEQKMGGIEDMLGQLVNMVSSLERKPSRSKEE